MHTRTRPSLPTGHGELLAEPAFAEWEGLVRRNAAVSVWEFEVAGRSARTVRASARREVLAAAEAFSARLGVTVRSPEDPATPIIMTGHQPELYHPGVWAKDFLLQRLADEIGATPVDIVVDSDGFEMVSATSPCLAPRLQRCVQHLAIAEPGACYACSPVPTFSELEEFRNATRQALSTLPAPAIANNFDGFGEALVRSAEDAESLSELVTFARRRYESAAGTDYLELPVTSLVRGEAFAAFVVDLAFDADRFASAYNAELASYRADNRVRTKAQPFPDLGAGSGGVELPLWSLRSRKRESLWAERGPGGLRLAAGGSTVLELPDDREAAIGAVLGSGSLIAPKALALTLFLRLFCCDFFIHGVGGGRYDRVTDGVCRRYFGIEPPAFAVASLTMYLPLGEKLVAEEDVAEAKELLNRLEHNPDALVGEATFGSDAERQEAASLAAEKKRLVAEISAPDADKKTLGKRIREVNQRLAELLEPLRSDYVSRLAELEERSEASEILTDRTYPFCFWTAEEIAEKTR